MQDTAKYLIHADITANGVVERPDVVGAVFGQTEGLLGDELDLRDLQDSSKVGRIDVDIDSQNGQSFGRITIATSLDQVETAILGAALETIDRVGPCRSTIEVRRIEDVRAAKRREIVERAQAILSDAFDESMLSSRELVDAVRESVRVEDITEYEGLPAGPRVVDGDAIIVVEGRSDVATLLRYGIKNAIAVEGTNVPDAVAELTAGRTVTAFLDGDRGGELILKELAQVGEIDYVAFAPDDQCVEDLDRHEVMVALREKIPYERIAAEETGRIDASGADRAEAPDPTPDGTADDEPSTESPDSVDGDRSAEVESSAEPVDETSTANGAAEETEATEPETLRDHVEQVIGEGSGRARVLDADFRSLGEDDADAAFELLESTEPVPTALVVDGAATQRLLDVAAQRGVDQIVAASDDDYVKRPTSVRVRLAEELRPTTEA